MNTVEERKKLSQDIEKLLVEQAYVLVEANKHGQYSSAFRESGQMTNNIQAMCWIHSALTNPQQLDENSISSKKVEELLDKIISKKFDELAKQGAV